MNNSLSFLRRVLVLVILVVAGRSMQGQPIENQLQQLSLEDLLNLKVEAASLSQASSIRETPNVVTVITREEIRQIGARNLVDILQLVPGVTFGQDIQNNVGIGMRGIWAVEAKVLILLDGQVMNDLAFLIAQFEHNYYMDQIERIEVIRGAGSPAAINVASIGVINIITHKEQPDGSLRVSGSLGSDGRNTLRRTIGLSVNHSFSPRKYYSMHGFTSNGLLSNTVMPSVNPLDTRYQAQLPSLANTQQYTNMKFRAGDFYGIFIHSDNLQACQSFGFQTWSRPYTFRYRHTLGELRYLWRLSDVLTLSPKVSARYGSAYDGATTPVAADTASTYATTLWGNTPVTQYQATLEANYQPTTKIEVLGGVQYQTSTMKYDINAGPGRTMYNGNPSSTFGIFGTYLNSVARFRAFNAIAAVRADYHNQFGWMAAPRFAITRVQPKWHVKAMYSQAYRFPSLISWDLANAIPYFNQAEVLEEQADYTGRWASKRLFPEQTQVAELEAGALLGAKFAAALNLSRTASKAPIVYVLDSLARQTYYNHPSHGSVGMEAELRYRNSKLSLTGSFTRYWLIDRGNIHPIEEYLSAADGDSDGSLGLPEYKAVLQGTYQFNKHLSLFTSALFLGEIWLITSGSTPLGDRTEVAQTNLLLNANLLYRDLLTPGLDIQIAGYNLANNSYKLGQAYAAGDRALVHSPREVILTVMYRFNND